MNTNKDLILGEVFVDVPQKLDYTNIWDTTAFPMEHWKRIRTNNSIERLNREIRRRTSVVGTFPDGHAALMLVCARLKYVADSEWGTRKYLDVSLIEY